MIGLASRLKVLLQDWNSNSDEYSDIVIQREYRGLLHIIALYPNVNKSGVYWSVLRVSILLTLLFLHCCCLGTNAASLYSVNFIYFTSALHYFFVVGISFEYLLLFNTRRKFLASYHSRIYSNFYDYREGTDDQIRDIFKASEKRKKRLVILPLFATSAAAFIVLLAPTVDKYGTFDINIAPSLNFNLPTPMWYFFDTFTIVGFTIALLHQMTAIMMCGLLFSGAGYMYMVMVNNLITQLKILIHRIDTIEDRALMLYVERFGSKPIGSDYQLYSDRCFEQCMDVCLRRCVEHHKVILRNFNELNDFASVQLFSIFLVGGFLIALAMLGSGFWKVLPGQTIGSLVLCVTEIAFIGTLSSLGQTVIDLNEEVRVAIYGVKWYHCNKRFCQNILILLVNTLKPGTFTACGLIKICYDTYANIINTAYSYYNIVIATRN